MLKVLVVTSEINYMPENYNGLIHALLRAQGKDYHIVGVSELKTLDRKLLVPLLKMPFVGMRDMPAQILRNIKDEKINRTKEKILSLYNCPHLKWDSMNTDEAYEWVKKHEIDLILNIRTRCIYKKKILEAPRLGCINIHHGILPHFRGTLCDLYALSENRPAGYSIHKMVKKIDDGEIYKVTEVYHRKASEKVSYNDYLQKTIEHEIEDLTSLLKDIAHKGKLPQPLNITSKVADITYTKNPSPKQIIQFLKQGIRL